MNMANIERYIIVGNDGHEEDHEHTDCQEAIRTAKARKPKCAVIAHIYEWSDSEVVYDPKRPDEQQPRRDRE